MADAAYIYRRFSTDEQERGSGDTLARQKERCEAFAAERGWAVAETLTDKGRSAFKGEHLHSDAELGKFVARVMQGDIARGSILIGERLDRLSRRPVGEAMAWIHMMTNAGILIAIADSGMVFGDKQDMGSFLTAAIQVGVGHEESRKKSEQTLLAKQKLWKLGETKTGRWTNLAAKLPTWLERNVTEDGWIVDERRAEVIRAIFQMSADGVGVNTITWRLNEADPPIPPFATPIRYRQEPHKWGRSGVRQLLLSPSVEGDLIFKSGMLAGRVIHDFFPRIVDADLVARARADLKARRKEAGKGAKAGSGNLFAGITVCGVCGRRAFLSTSIQKGRSYPYLRCEAASERRCENTNGYAYAAFEETVLDLFLDLALDDRFFAATDELRAARVRKAEIEKTLNDKRAFRARLLQMFGDGDDQAIAMINQTKADIEALDRELGEADATIHMASGRVSNIEHLRRVGDIREAAKSDNAAVRAEARSKLRLALSSILQNVEIDRDEAGQKVFTVILKGGVMAVRIDTKGKVLKGVSEALGQPLWAFLPAEDQEALAPLIRRLDKLAV